MTFPDPVQLAIPVFIAAMVIEMVAIRRGARGDYDWRDTGTSLAMGFGSTIAGALAAGGIVALGDWLWQFRLFDIPATWWAVALCFVADDFLYYWFHRSAHRVRWFWASHVIHHSSQHYNLSTALRQTWTGFISLGFIFRLPLFLVGFPPRMILFCAGWNLVYQFFIHTESVQKLPKSLEWLLNSPSHHRVHHGTNARYLDRNYAGVFIIWDRLFGTFEAERDDEPVRYGIVRNLATFNPLWVAVHEWVAIGTDVVKARGLRGKWMAIAGPPGWHSGTTADTIRAHWQSGREAEPQRMPPVATPAE
ncbi:sterol desaturase family protein [Sandarakinorhabdus sp. DWP1-3-1]|uniref:sterol desaturase family protein n=1 Tax=Sandarakinorhabdus sp. DWP1-3-1 TaxID=2804627 RepID=UPI003CEC8E25